MAEGLGNSLAQTLHQPQSRPCALTDVPTVIRPTWRPSWIGTSASRVVAGRTSVGVHCRGTHNGPLRCRLRAKEMIPSMGRRERQILRKLRNHVAKVMLRSKQLGRVKRG